MIRNRLLTASIALIALSFGIINCAQKPVAPWTSHSTYGIDDKTMAFVEKTFDEAGNLISSTFNRVDTLPNTINKIIDINLPKLLIGSACLSTTVFGLYLTYTAYNKYWDCTDTTDEKTRTARKKGTYLGWGVTFVGLAGLGGFCYYLNRQPKLTN